MAGGDRAELRGSEGGQVLAQARPFQQFESFGLNQGVLEEVWRCGMVWLIPLFNIYSRLGDSTRAARAAIAVSGIPLACLRLQHG